MTAARLMAARIVLRVGLVILAAGVLLRDDGLLYVAAGLFVSLLVLTEDGAGR